MAVLLEIFWEANFGIFLGHCCVAHCNACTLLNK